MSISEINPDEFVIKHRRKLYKFALFANSDICYEMDEWKSRQIDVIEIGAGTGLFSVELATRHPDQTFLAVDVKADRLQTGARLAIERGLTNIWFVRSRADLLDQLVPDHSVQSLWLTFADPFPRQRADGRRMTHPHFLRSYAKVLGKEGALYIKHDNGTFFDWSLEQLAVEKWSIDELSNDLHDSDLPDDYKILTTYETRWLGEGLVTNFVRTTPPKPTK
ncbi:MAG: tRNA (guanine-N7)-methyltransferase [Candidatus Saccharibacteria bacterium]|nr:tRNA (guanine-N7)-methyltransferase [Candidatus Saccharibacteria bacterium]